MDYLPEGTRMSNLNGIPVRNPQPGTVVVIVSRNGSAQKVLVK